MKILLAGILAATALLQQKCNREPVVTNCYKGRLEIKALCANYTISVLEGNLDASKIEASWTDENTGKTYKNVFALGSPCTFPESLEEGKEFYFTLAETNNQCAVCQAYYPKPGKALSITVLDKPCR
ncbi:MAG: hypothetical protein M3Q06_07345 [Bacteroidota bacterium]|nr:hypothetical protein [Bacteroidota bacterium]